MFKYAMISISTLGLFSAATVPARAELSQAPAPLTVVSKVQTPVLANICGNGIVEEGEACDGGSNCTADCEGGMYNADAPTQDVPFQKQRPEIGKAQEGPSFEGQNPEGHVPGVDSVPELQAVDKPAYGPVNPGQDPGHELAPLDKPEIGPLPGPEQCGNGAVESGEDCDDGNTITGDGCDSFCRIEEASDSQPLVDKTPRPGSRGEDSRVGFSGNPFVSGSGCSLQALSPQSGPVSALTGILLLALPMLRASFPRRR